MNIEQWVFGIIAGLLVMSVGALFRLMIQIEHRISNIEAGRQYLRELIDQRMDQLESKLEELSSRLEQVLLRRNSRS